MDGGKEARPTSQRHCAGLLSGIPFSVMLDITDEDRRTEINCGTNILYKHYKTHLNKNNGKKH